MAAIRARHQRGVRRFGPETLGQTRPWLVARFKTEQKQEANSVGVDQVVGIDDSGELDELPELDAIADTVDHDVIGKLIS